MPKMARRDGIRPSIGFKQSLKCVASNGGELKHDGETDHISTTRENTKASWAFQAAKVNSALLAVADRVDEGYRAVRDRHMPTDEDIIYVFDKCAKDILRMYRHGSFWSLTPWWAMEIDLIILSGGVNPREQVPVSPQRVDAEECSWDL